MELMMKVDLNELVQAKFAKLIESMLFVIVEAIQFLDVSPQAKANGDGTEIATLEFVRESFMEKKQKVEKLMKVLYF
jgi:hypothetical protein